LVGSIIQKFPQKLSAQRTAKGPISISECCVDGEYIVIENTSKRNEVNMTNWVLSHCVGSVRKVSFRFPENFILKSKQTVKLWAGSRNSTTNNMIGSNKTSKPSSSSSSLSSSSSSSLSSKSANLNGIATSSSNGYNNSNGFYLANGSNKDGYTNATLLNELIPTVENIENELILYDIENWTCGSQEIFIRLENEFGEEKASFRKTN
jgi:hypothetical protein